LDLILQRTAACISEIVQPELGLALALVAVEVHEDLQFVFEFLYLPCSAFLFGALKRAPFEPDSARRVDIFRTT